MISKQFAYFKDLNILLTGGTGSLGQKLVERIMAATDFLPSKLVVFSRDEAKQYKMKLQWERKRATEEAIYRQPGEILQFKIGDIRNPESICGALRDTDIVINAAALKQVPSCEYFPMEAVQTNILGASNIVTAIANHNLPVETVVGVSTDKACKPVNTMGMTKAIQERIFIEGNLRAPRTRFICTRYGNIVSSRGSVVPLFKDQVRRGEPFTVTSRAMTRFLMPLDRAVDAIFDAIVDADPGETFIPKIKSARITDIAWAVAQQASKMHGFKVTGIRPGEKLHEVLVSEEECSRTRSQGAYFVIQPILPELKGKVAEQKMRKEFSSKDWPMSIPEIRRML